MADRRAPGSLFWLCIFTVIIEQQKLFTTSAIAQGKHNDRNYLLGDFDPEKSTRNGNVVRQRSADVFRDFYTSDQYSRPLLQNFKGDREYSYIPDENQDDSVLKDKKDPPNKDEITLMNRLWMTLRVGNLPKIERGTNGYVPGYSYRDHMREHAYLNDGSYLEIGTGITAHHLAAWNDTETTAAAIVMPDTYLPQISKYSEDLNLFLHSMDLEDLSEALDELQIDYQTMFGTILLSNLTALIGDNLPHEYEELLAKIFSLSRNTLVSHANTKDANMESYFSNWENINALLRGACDIGGLECEVSLVLTTPFWKTEDDSLLSLVVLKSAQRNLPNDLCNDIEKGKKCSLVYIKNGTDELTIQYDDDDDSYTLPPLRSHSIPLNTLLRLGPTRSTKERLVRQFLQLPYKRQMSTQTLHVYPNRMQLYLPEDDELFLDRNNEGERLHAWVDTALKLGEFATENHIRNKAQKRKTNINNYEDYHVVDRNLEFDVEYEDGVRSQDVFDLRGQGGNGANIHMRGPDNMARRRRVRQDDTEVEEDPGEYFEQQKTQLDGVARMWDRENIPREAHQKGQLQKMSEHWERDLEEGDYKNQEERLEDGERELKGVEKMFVRDEGNDDEEDAKNEADGELTKDEEDLMKAMKILAEEREEGGQDVAMEQEGGDDDDDEQDEIDEEEEEETDGDVQDDGDDVGDDDNGDGDVDDDNANELDEAADVPDNAGNQIDNVQNEFVLRVPNDDHQPAGGSDKDNAGHHLPGGGAVQDNMQDNGGQPTRIGVQNNMVPVQHVINADSEQLLQKDAPLLHPIQNNDIKDSKKTIKNENNLVGGSQQNEQGIMKPRLNLQRGKKVIQEERKQDTNVKVHQERLRVPKKSVDEQAPKTKFRETAIVKNGDGDKGNAGRVVEKVNRHDEQQDDLWKKKKDKMRSKLLGVGRYPKQEQQVDDASIVNGEKVRGPQRRLLALEGVDGNTDEDPKSYVQKLLDLCSTKCQALTDIANTDGHITAMPTLDSDTGKVEATVLATDITPFYDGNDDADDDRSSLDKLRYRQLRSHDAHRNELLYDREWRVLKKYFMRSRSDENFNVLTYGGEQQSLIGAKVARMFPNSTVITVIPPSQKNIVTKHRKLQNSLQFQNNLLVLRQLSSELIYKLYRLPELFKFQVLGLTMFDQIVSVGHNFVKLLSQVLSLSQVTFMEVPSPAQLILADVLFGNHTGFKESGPAVYKGLIYEALKFANIEDAKVEIIDDSRFSRKMASLKLLKVEVKTLKRQVLLDCKNNMGDLSLGTDGAVTITLHSKTDSTPILSRRAMKTVGLETLLTIGLQNMERMTLFKSYLMMPQHKDMCPFHIIWYQDRLLYDSITSPATHFRVDQKVEKMETNALLEILKQQLNDEPFSFMQYNSRNDDLILTLASKYPNSTFISLLENMDDAKDVYEKVKTRNLSNTLVTALVSGIDESFAQKLVESPEFLRYQFIDLNQFLEMVDSPDAREDFNQILGSIISSGVTTFIQLPSAYTLSMAFSTFFPDAYNGQEKHPATNDERYMYANHPSPFYKNAEIKMIHESAQANGNVTVKSKVLYPSHGPPAVEYSWNLLRIDVTNLSTIVDHHFDYALDGHQRKYTLHCLSNETNYQVYLVRNKDGFVIPYGDVNGISVIALLRMGLLQELKDRFYNLFVHMPLYEDMAPWNIIFRAGELQYIDYDTKDLTLTHMVPAAYQVMSMLMNYERTVHDFGNCNGASSNPYNFPFISNCVGSDFNGPCHDSRYPVPCGDHTCRSTYVECLRALSDLELKKNAGKPNHSDSMTSETKEDAENYELFEDGKVLRWKMHPKQAR